MPYTLSYLDGGPAWRAFQVLHKTPPELGKNAVLLGNRGHVPLGRRTYALCHGLEVDRRGTVVAQLSNCADTLVVPICRHGIDLSLQHNLCSRVSPVHKGIQSTRLDSLPLRTSSSASGA